MRWKVEVHFIPKSTGPEQRARYRETRVAGRSAKRCGASQSAFHGLGSYPARSTVATGITGYGRMHSDIVRVSRFVTAVGIWKTYSLFLQRCRRDSWHELAGAP